MDQRASCPLCRHPVGPEVRARFHFLDLRDRDDPTNKVLLGISTSRHVSFALRSFILLLLPLAVLLAFPKEYMERRQMLKDESASAHADPCNLPLYVNQMALPGHTVLVNFHEARYVLPGRRLLSLPANARTPGTDSCCVGS